MSKHFDHLLSLCREEREFLVSIRRHLHEHPELSGREENTIAYLAGQFSGMGMSPKIVENGGILVRIPGGKTPDTPNRPTLLMRADCDALPISEEPHEGAERTCTSQNPGVCHACGHDAHAAVMLTAARVLWKIRDTLPGDVIIMIERSEEVPYNKCLLRLMQALEKDGQHIDGVWGMHCAPEPAGQIQLDAGGIMSGTLFFDFALHGKGGHGSRPDLCQNPIDCFSAVHQALTQLPVRLVSPFLPASLAVTYVNGGTRNNVIAPELTFGGTARFFDVETGFRLQQQINRIVESTAALYGCSVIGRAAEPFFPLINHPACVETARRAFGDSPLAPKVVSGPPTMVAETFATLACRWPSAFIQYGIADPGKGIGSGLHTPTFDVDEGCLPDAAAAAVIYADAFLSALADLADPLAGQLRANPPEYHDRTAAELFKMQGISSDEN